MDTCPQHKVLGQRPNPANRVEMIAAIVDRITVNARIIEIGTESYRTAKRRHDANVRADFSTWLLLPCQLGRLRPTR
jgi:hypothetical protein